MILRPQCRANLLGSTLLIYIFLKIHIYVSLDLKKTEINKESKILAEAVEERKTSTSAVN